jgi:hypothetical protein
MAITSWKKKIDVALAHNSGGWGNIEAIEIIFKPLYIGELQTFVETLTIEQINNFTITEKLNLEFDDGHSTGTCPIQFQIWTKKFIYFSCEYDCSDFVISKSRCLPEVKDYDENFVYIKKAKKARETFEPFTLIERQVRNAMVEAGVRRPKRDSVQLYARDLEDRNYLVAIYPHGARFYSKNAPEEFFDIAKVPLTFLYFNNGKVESLDMEHAAIVVNQSWMGY